uniref:NADH-ubiquinone oxidoreductase chain 2 n=2 Tax=unclassified Paroedura TaxID=2640277 RepID=M1EWH2_9SAUR|nr:NADH dehydrogenase subunit 2 [Paroedura sp. tg1064]AFB35659.1 NADH dehydrogenase subunit 2 [Paroedura sp. tg1062]
MAPAIWTLLLMALSTSTIITMASHHWLLAWLGLELNTISMLPLIMKLAHPRTTKTLAPSFLVQAISAAIILFASTLNAWQTGQWSISHTTNNTPVALIVAALALKLGLAPAHLWYVDVLQGASMSTALVITTWQKIAPLTLIYMLHNNIPTHTLQCLGLLSALTGAWTGLNQTQLRKIMAASSIAHMGWVITAMTLQQNTAIIVLTIYFTSTTAIFTILITTSTKTLQDMGTVWTMTPPLLTSALLTIMSLGGLPPLTGFMPKWLVLKELSLLAQTPFSTTLALTSLPSLYFYIRMTLVSTLTTSPNTTNTEQSWRFKPYYHMIMPLTLTLSLILLPLTSLIHTMT